MAREIGEHETRAFPYTYTVHIQITNESVSYPCKLSTPKSFPKEGHVSKEQSCHFDEQLMTIL